jgi:hypothetical protein
LARGWTSNAKAKAISKPLVFQRRKEDNKMKFVGFTAVACAVLLAGWLPAQVASNVGYGAKKYDGRPGVPIYPDQKTELEMKIKHPFTVLAVGDLLEFRPFSKMIDHRLESAETIGAKWVESKSI